MTGTKAAHRLGPRVESRAEVISAEAPVENHQPRYLCGQFRFAIFFEKLAKFGC